MIQTCIHVWNDLRGEYSGIRILPCNIGEILWSTNIIRYYIWPLLHVIVAIFCLWLHDHQNSYPRRFGSASAHHQHCASGPGLDQVQGPHCNRKWQGPCQDLYITLYNYTSYMENRNIYKWVIVNTHPCLPTGSK